MSHHATHDLKASAKETNVNSQNEEQKTFHVQTRTMPRRDTYDSRRSELRNTLTKEGKFLFDLLVGKPTSKATFRHKVLTVS